MFSGACDELEQDSPLRALREALEVERGAPDPARAELARLLESGSPEREAHGLGAVDEGWLIVEAVLGVLEQFASTAPVASRAITSLSLLLNVDDRTTGPAPHPAPARSIVQVKRQPM